MPLFSVHCVAAGKSPETGERITRWLVMPIRAESLCCAVEDPEVKEMLARLVDGMQAPIVVTRQSYPERY